MKRTLPLILVLTGIGLVCGGQAKPIPCVLKVQAAFTAPTEFGSYTDAIYVPAAQYRKFATDEAFIASLQPQMQARIDNWVNIVKNPPKPVEPTKAQLEQEVVEIDQQKVSLDARKVELLALIAAKAVEEKVK